MKKPSFETTVSLLIAVALHIVLIAALIRAGTFRRTASAGPTNIVRIEGAGGAVAGAGPTDFAASAAPDEGRAICSYSQVGGTFQLDTTTTPTDNPAFTKCPAGVAQIAAATKVSGVFKFILRHRRVAESSVIESTGSSTTDSSIVASIVRQGFWTDARAIQPEWITYVFKLGN